MNRLTLSKPRRVALPESVTVDGVEYEIRADFRTQLKIFRLLEDESIAERHKKAMACMLFFGSKQPQNGLEVWREWIQGVKLEKDPDAPPMSYEWDAGDIYASFLMQYRIDLLDEGVNLHWYQFSALLHGLGEDTPLGRTLSIRGMDTSKLKGNARTKAERAKRNAQIREHESVEDKRKRAEIENALMRGEDVGALLGR